MTKKKEAAPKSGAFSRGKKPANAAPLATSHESPETPAPASPPASISSDAGEMPPSPSSTTESMPPESALDALAVLDSAAAAINAEPVAPVAPAPLFGGASDAERQLTEAAVANAAGGEAPKGKSGWPKGRPRKPRLDSSAFPQRPASGPSGASADERTTAQLRQRVAELEAQNSESVKLAMTAGFAQIARIGFGIVARRNGVHWYLTPEEAAEIGSACGGAALPYVSYIAPALPFIAAVGAIYGSVASRMEIDTEIEQGKRARILPGEETK